MKLNKNGWGLTMELVFLLIFVVCLIIASIGLYKTGLLKNFNQLLNPNYYASKQSEEEKKFSYEELENKLVNSTKLYVNDIYNNELGLDTLIIRVSLLKSKGYLTELKDDKNRDCSGYAEVYLNNDDNIIYKPYLKCEKYETDGYLERKDN